MKTSVMKKSLLDYAIKGFLSTKFRKDNPTLNALSEIESYNASILKDKRAKEKALKTLESSLKNEKDKEAKQNLKAQITALKKEIAKLKLITPLESPNTFAPPFAIPESWVWVKLGDISNYGQTTQINPKYLTADDWILELEDIEKESGVLLNKQYFFSRQSKSNKIQFSKGDILFGTLRPYLKKIIIADDMGFCSSEIMPFTTNNNIRNKYVAHFLMSDFCGKTISMLTYGTRMPRLGTQDARNLLIPLPPLQEQKQIVQILDQLMDLANEFERTQENLKRIEKRIEKSLLKFAIQGNLSKCYRKDNPSLNALSEIESYNASILKDKKAKEKALKTLESSLKNEKDKEAKQNLKAQMTALKKEITKLKLITPLTCHSERSEESIQSQHTKSPTTTISIENANFQNTFTPPFAIPESWVWVRLGDICEIINGISIVGIRLPALDVKYLRTKTNKIVLNGGNMVNINDRIILMDGENSGEVFVVKEKGFLGSTLKKLNFSKMVKIEFMDYLLLFYKDLLKGNKKGAAIPHLDRHLFLNLQIALPPLQEQKEIVKILDSLFTLAKGLRVK